MVPPVLPHWIPVHLAWFFSGQRLLTVICFKFPLRMHELCPLSRKEHELSMTLARPIAPSTHGHRSPSRTFLLIHPSWSNAFLYCFFCVIFTSIHTCQESSLLKITSLVSPLAVISMSSFPLQQSHQFPLSFSAVSLLYSLLSPF